MSKLFTSSQVVKTGENVDVEKMDLSKQVRRELKNYVWNQMKLMKIKWFFSEQFVLLKKDLEKKYPFWKEVSCVKPWHNKDTFFVWNWNVSGENVDLET